MSCTRNHTIKEINMFFDNHEVISVIFSKDTELGRQELRRITKFLEGVKKTRAILILNGIGGDACYGKELAIKLRKKFHKTLWIIIPDSVSSSLVYSILISQGVILGEKSYITPIDPLVYCMGRFRTASRNIKSSNPGIQKKATEEVINTANFIIKILETPGSVLTSPNKLNIGTFETIVKPLIAPYTHDNPLYYEDLRKMKFRCETLSKEDILWCLIDKYYKTCINDLKTTNKRFIIERKNKFVLY